MTRLPLPAVAGTLAATVVFALADDAMTALVFHRLRLAQ